MVTNARQKITNTFNIDHVSDIDNKRYVGSFTTKKLSIKDTSSIGVRRTQLNGGMHHDAQNPGQGIDEQTDWFNYMVAVLEVSILQAPAWWDLNEVTDLDLFQKVFKEVISFENSFLRRAEPEQTSSVTDVGGSGEGNSPQTQAKAIPAGGAGTVVVGQVPSALEP